MSKRDTKRVGLSARRPPKNHRANYEGMTKGSITSAKLMPASLYTHIKDMRPGSPTFGQRIER